jgi:hypothetical protein
MPNSTTNYGLFQPLVNNATDQDLWGNYLNSTIGYLDTLVQTTMNWTPTAETSNFNVTAPTTGTQTTGSAKLIYRCNATGGAIVPSLPAASTCSGMSVAFVKTDSSANTITITANGVDTIAGAATLVLSTQYSYAVINSNGTTWDILAQTPPSVTVPILRQSEVTAAGAFNFTTASNITTNTVFKFTITGAGAGGGGGTQGSGGGSGSTGIWWVSGLAPNTSYSGSIGTGGAGGTSGNAGSAGGNTTFTVGGTTITAPGGGAGQAGGLTSSPAGLGGGACTNCTDNNPGNAGGFGIGSYGAGFGGGSFWGGSAPASVSGAGNNGTAAGAGASGANSGTGGTGSNGKFVAEWVA